MDYKKAYLSLCKLIVETSPANLLAVKQMCEQVIIEVEKNKSNKERKEHNKNNKTENKCNN